VRYDDDPIVPQLILYELSSRMWHLVSLLASSVMLVGPHSNLPWHQCIELFESFVSLLDLVDDKDASVGRVRLLVSVPREGKH
jgi:hypothetical protein